MGKRTIFLYTASTVFLVGGLTALAVGSVICGKRGVYDTSAIAFLVAAATCIVVSIAFLSVLVVLYRRERSSEGSMFSYYLTARLCEPGAALISGRDKVRLSTGASICTASGIEVGIDPDSYVLNIGNLDPNKLSKRNTVAFHPEFPAAHDKVYFRTVLSNYLFKVSDGYDRESDVSRTVPVIVKGRSIRIHVGVDIREDVAGHILHYMALTEKLVSGEGIRFYRWLCYCVLGMGRGPSPSQQDTKDAVGCMVFAGFPGAYVAMRSYKSAFIRVVEYNKRARAKPVVADSWLHQGPELLLPDEVEFLENLMAAADTYVLPLAERFNAERQLTEMLALIYMFTNKMAVEIFDEEKITSWLRSLMTYNAGCNMGGICVAMSSLGYRRFHGTVFHRIYTELCNQEASFGACRGYISDLLLLCEETVTDATVSEVLERRGVHFCAAAAVMIPYFLDTAAHNKLLSVDGYPSCVAELTKNISIFEHERSKSRNLEPMASLLSYHEGKGTACYQDDSVLYMYVSQLRTRVLRLLDGYSDLSFKCSTNEWKEPGALKFFVQLQVWMSEAKELCLLRNKKPAKPGSCSVLKLFSSYIHEYWGYVGVDVFCGHDGSSIASSDMFKSDVKIGFNVKPEKESVVVCRSSLSQVFAESVEQEERVAH